MTDLSPDPVTEKILRKAHCPVLVVRKPAHDFVHPEEAARAVRLKKILFEWTFPMTRTRALTYSLSLAMEYNADLTLLHVPQAFG